MIFIMPEFGSNVNIGQTDGVRLVVIMYVARGLFRNDINS